MTALPRRPRSRPGGPVRYLSSTAGAGRPGPARQGETACPAPQSARASRQPKQHCFGAEPTGHLTLTPTSGWTITRVTMAHQRPAMRGRRQWPVRRRADRYDPRRPQPPGECRPLTAARLQLPGHRTQPARAMMPTAAARITRVLADLRGLLFDADHDAGYSDLGIMCVHESGGRGRWLRPGRCGAPAR